MNFKNLSVETLAVQGGYEPKNSEARILPIYQSTTFKYDSSDEVAELFDLKKEGHMYSRISNPTVEALEKKVAQLENGIGAVATSSGQSATLLSILTICSSGDNIVAMNNLYGGTYTLIGSTLKQFGITTSFVNLNNEKELQNAIKENTKLVFSETIGNPGIDLLDIEKIANIAHKNNILLIVDNTFATPVLCRPFEYGADIITHSSTKYLDGHATSVGGIVVDSGKFNWNNGKFNCLTDNDPNYHDLSYTNTFKEFAYLTRLRAVFLRDIGCTMSPFNAFLTNLGSETLSIRMDKHSENALEIAKFLEKNENVEWVNYPLLENNKNYKLAQKYLPKGASGVISFGIKGGLEETKKWIDNLKLATLVVHVGDVRTHALHPASMTHRQLSEKAQIEAGILPNMIRLSVGIEDVNDIINDLKQAFNKER